MRPEPIEPMRFRSSFIDIDELDDVAPPSATERRIGVASAIALGALGLTVAVGTAMHLDEIGEMLRGLGVLIQTVAWLFGAETLD